MPKLVYGIPSIDSQGKPWFSVPCFCTKLVQILYGFCTGIVQILYRTCTDSVQKKPGNHWKITIRFGDQIRIDQIRIEMIQIRF